MWARDDTQSKSEERKGVKETDLRDGEVERLATGFKFVEGPVWHKGGYWLFSDIPANPINKISPQGTLETYREP